MLRLALLLVLWHCSCYFAGYREKAEEEGGRYLGLRSASRGTVLWGDEVRGLVRIRSGKAEVQVVRRMLAATGMEKALAEERIGFQAV